VRRGSGRSASARPPTPEKLSRLAAPIPRKEKLETPAPYSWQDTRDSARIPHVIGTGPRFPPPLPPRADALECNLDAVEPKSKTAVISGGERWPADPEEAPRLYDVEKGLQATEAKSFAATFSTSTRPQPRPASPHFPDQAHHTIAHSKVVGGRFTSERRDTAEHFMVHSESPGPIYEGSRAPLEAKTPCPVFSRQAREPPMKSFGPGPLAYADAVVQKDRLSTHRRAPSPAIGDVPNSSSMPFPYTAQNICNSRSMRTAFCESFMDTSAARERRSHKVGPASVPRRRPDSAMSAGSSDCAAKSALRHILRTRAAVAANSSQAPPWASPFAAPRGVATPKLEDTRVDASTLERHLEHERQREAAAEPGGEQWKASASANADLRLGRARPASALSTTSGRPPSSHGARSVSAASTSPSRAQPTASPSVAGGPISRFAHAKKYPRQFIQEDERDCHAARADGAMAVLISAARKAHPEGTLAERRARATSASSSRPSSAAADHTRLKVYHQRWGSSQAL
jgi:hypothetical protein